MVLKPHSRWVNATIKKIHRHLVTTSQMTQKVRTRGKLHWLFLS
ncbi:hypothetical protein F385_3150 [Pantoea agglomerans 299R]|nr:hypothetical protein F385_3150 [Pantoea agglomerans 299R]